MTLPVTMTRKAPAILRVSEIKHKIAGSTHKQAPTGMYRQSSAAATPILFLAPGRFARAADFISGPGPVCITAVCPYFHLDSTVIENIRMALSGSIASFDKSILKRQNTRVTTRSGQIFEEIRRNDGFDDVDRIFVGEGAVPKYLEDKANGFSDLDCQYFNKERERWESIALRPFS